MEREKQCEIYFAILKDEQTQRLRSKIISVLSGISILLLGIFALIFTNNKGNIIDVWYGIAIVICYVISSVAALYFNKVTRNEKIAKQLITKNELTWARYYQEIQKDTD